MEYQKYDEILKSLSALLNESKLKESGVSLELCASVIVNCLGMSASLDLMHEIENELVRRTGKRVKQGKITYNVC